MSYRVLYAEQFQRQLNEQLDYFEHEGAPSERISNWLNDMLLLMQSLEELPHRFPIAKVESEIAVVELRRVVFEHYLLFYHVNEGLKEVQVYGFRHSARLL